MNKERLLRLADFLEKEVPAAHFDMTTWVAGLMTSGPDGFKKLGECGTTACAFGWATQIPEFADAGLELCGGEVILRRPDMDKRKPAWGDGAAEEFFSLDGPGVDHLFHSSGYGWRTPKEVAAQIRKYVKEEETEE